jgi:hypothetical protein
VVEPVRSRSRIRYVVAAILVVVPMCAAWTAPLIAAASTPAQIVVNSSIDGVRLGSTEGTVRRLLGKPSSTAKCSTVTVCVPPPGRNPPGTVTWSYRTQGDYVFIKGHVALMAAYSKTQKTAAGVGPGTSLKVAKKHYPKLTFHHFLPDQPPSGYYVTAPPTKTGDDFTMLVMYQPSRRAPMQVDWVEVGRWNNGPNYVCDFTICS